MKKMILVMILTFSLFFTLVGDQVDNPAINKSDSKEEKRLMDKVSPFLVKVIAEHVAQNKRYVVTGLAIFSDRVLTSALITRNPYERITVLTASGRVIDTQLLGVDQNSSLAVLKLKNASIEYVHDTKAVAVGDPVWLMGAFYQNFPSVFKGVVSSVNDQEIVINGPIIPGASGGAVITSNGALAGVIRGRIGFAWNRDLRIRNDETEFVFSGENPGQQPLLLALPIDNAKRIATDLIELGYVRQGWVGLWGVQAQNGMVEISEVSNGSPAHKAGIEPGDVIVSIDNKPLTRITSLRNTVINKRPGESIRLGVRRQNKLQDIVVEVGENRDALAVAPSNPLSKVPDGLGESWTIPNKSAPILGLLCSLIGKDFADSNGIKEGYGILVHDVLSASPLKQSKLRAGDILVEVNGQAIRSQADLEMVAQAMQTMRLDQPDSHSAQLRYYRNHQPQTITIQLPNESLPIDEIQNLRQRMDRFSDFLRDKEFQAINQVLQEMQEQMQGRPGADQQAITRDMIKLEKRIDAYYKGSLQRIEQEYKLLQERLAQLKKQPKQDR